MWSIALSQTHDNELTTIASSLIYPTRAAAVQGLWEMIVRENYYYASVFDMWEHLFDDVHYSDTLDNAEVYNVTNADDYDYKLIRKLITPEMNERIKEINRIHNEEIEEINDEEIHLDHSNQLVIKELNAKRRRYFNSYERLIKPINAVFEEHLCSVPMSEDEIKYFMENFSECSEEFGAGSQILTSWDIREVKIYQQTQIHTASE